ncbi:hypothetical protein [Moorella sulfitireducens (nom. illeg.)]|uniref:hypothetical protein n=1 Tax=Neomoorella sulfitireducens TaxID=2972948 RepID=UPI0021ACB7F9|nr:hypothetical protein [Moorella sulfitireducens]
MGLCQGIKVMVSGGPVTGEYAKVIQADGYAQDARLAAEEALRLVGCFRVGEGSGTKSKNGVKQGWASRRNLSGKPGGS